MATLGPIEGALSKMAFSLPGYQSHFNKSEKAPRPFLNIVKNIHVCIQKNYFIVEEDTDGMVKGHDTNCY